MTYTKIYLLKYEIAELVPIISVNTAIYFMMMARVKMSILF